MLPVVKKGFSLVRAGVDVGMVQGLLKALRLSVNAKIARFGHVEALEEQAGGGLAMRLRLEGVADEVRLSVDRVAIAEDGSSVVLAGFASSVPLAGRLLEGFCANKAWDVEDQSSRLVLRQLAQALSC